MTTHVEYYAVLSYICLHCICTRILHIVLYIWMLKYGEENVCTIIQTLKSILKERKVNFLKSERVESSLLKRLAAPTGNRVETKTQLNSIDVRERTIEKVATRVSEFMKTRDKFRFFCNTHIITGV